MAQTLRTILAVCLATLLVSQCLVGASARAVPAGRMLQQGLLSGVTQPVVGGFLMLASDA